MNDIKNSRYNPSYCDPFNGKLKQQFVLPDYQKIMKGYVRQENEMLTSEDQVMEPTHFSVRICIKIIFISDILIAKQSNIIFVMYA